MTAASEVIAEGKDEESVVTMSMKSLTAAGKFKKRRYKEENQKKSSALNYFLTWFDHSQALERIINIERNRKRFKEDISSELIYMTKRVRKMTNFMN